MARRLKRASSAGGPVRSESGDTLIELLMALVIISLTVAGLLGALITSIATSGEHRSLTVDDTVLRSYAESYENQIEFGSAPMFQEGCAPDPYSTLTPPPKPSGYTVNLQVQYLNKSGAAFDQSCTANDNPNVQLITLTVSGSGAVQTLSFVVRNPD